MLINRNDFTAKDGATKSLYQLFVEIKKRDHLVRFLSLRTVRKYRPLITLKAILMVINSKVIVVNSLNTCLETSAKWVVRVSDILGKKIFIYVRENKFHYNYVYAQGLRQFQLNNLKEILKSKRIHYLFVSSTSHNEFNSFFLNTNLRTVIYNGIDLKKVKVLNSEKSKVVACIGAISKMKGYAYFAKLAYKWYSQDSTYRFHWYGDGPDRLDFIKLIDEYKLQGVLQIKPFQPISEILSKISAVVVCSESESFSRVAIESISNNIALLVKENLTAVIEVTDGCCYLLPENTSDINVHQGIEYIECSNDVFRGPQVASKYDIASHTSRFLSVILDK